MNFDFVLLLNYFLFVIALVFSSVGGARQCQTVGILAQQYEVAVTYSIGTSNDGSFVAGENLID